MTRIGDVHVCETCANKVKVLESGNGTLACCGETMKIVKVWRQ